MRTCLTRSPQRAGTGSATEAFGGIARLLLVAIDAEKVIGTVMGGWDGYRGWIYSVGVRATHRRRGIGSQLVLRMEQLLHERGCLKINLQVRTSNLQVIAFYE